MYAFAAKGYEPLLRWSLNHRGAVVAGAVTIFVATMLLVPRLGTELIPQLSQGEFDVDLRLSPGAPLVETDRAIQVVQDATRDIEQVDLNYSVAGTGNRLDANPVDAGENTGTLSITLRETRHGT
jgi:HAE1 family hydrophobic/amphiphilic exporter-1